MVRRLGGISPQKNLRKSTRTNCQLNRSLDENFLAESIIKNSTLLNDLARRANGLMGSESSTNGVGYTRTRARSNRYIMSSDEDEVMPAPSSRRTRRSSRTDNELHDDEDHDENMELSSRRTSNKRKRVAESDDQSEVGSTHNEERKLSLYDRVKRRQNDLKSTPPASSSNGVVITSRGERCLRRVSMASPLVDTSIRVGSKTNDLDTDAAKDDDDVDGEEVDDNNTEQDEDEEEEEEEQGPRKYLLRKRNPNPSVEYSNNVDGSSRSHRLEARMRRFSEPKRSNRSRDRNRRRDRSSRSTRRSEFKRRMCRSDSSSTGSEDEHDMQRSRTDEDRFERRKEISMYKARNRFVPVNLTEKDLTSSQTVIRERMRQTGASCSDIDPMSVDKEVNFEQVGGLGAHIQSLKEVVVFPLLYPDVFSQFNINPPKGVIFYGPPGTGKTLVARALANECSKGDKKVAFFMRKGADCLSKWVGESERQLRVLFDQAYAMRPSIIFFDEIDGLAPVRSSRQDQIHASIVSTLLALMDGLDNRGEVIVIGATNRLDTIDPALRRPGRFDRELKFSLPDVSSRHQILDIHTSKWGDNKPDADTLKWISENTSGYCGADLKYLCTESVLIALRARYPHIYMTSDRLKLDMNEIKVEKEHMLDAMRRITPASRRDLSIPSRPLNERTTILLESAISTLMATRIPAGYRASQSVQSTCTNDLEKVVRALEPTPTVHAVRLLMCGTEKFADGGQTSYALPAVLSRLDHLPVYSLAVSKLFADGRPEESFATTIQSALRSANTEPCILLLPSIDQWFKVVPPSVAHMLATALDQLTGYTSILFIATCDVSYAECPEEVFEIFRPANTIQMPTIPFVRRQKYFTHIVRNSLVPPRQFDASSYIAPEKATDSDVPARRLSPKEAKELEKLYENQLREFRIFLRDQLGRLIRDRRFNIFAEPVDEEEAEDYYQVITNPMCLTDMMDKVDRREYTHPDQFLADINLIKNNAIDYNPPDNLYRKTIRHSAAALRDIVEEYFDKEFEEDFVEKLEETSRLLLEADVVPKNEKLLSLPNGYMRKTKWNASSAFRANGRNKFAAVAVTPATPTSPADVTQSRSSSSLRRLRATNSQSQQKRKTAAIVNSIRESLTNNVDAGETVDGNDLEMEASSGEDYMGVNETAAGKIRDRKETETGDEMNGHDTDGQSSSVVAISSPCSPTKKRLIIDNAQLNEVISAAVQRTEDWPVPELERLAAEMSHTVEQYRNEWDRSRLPITLLSLVEEWEYETRKPLMVASSTH